MGWLAFGVRGSWVFIAPYVHESKCVDTQADYIDTTGYWLQNRLLGGTVALHVKSPAFTDAGAPAVFFTLEEISKSEEPLQRAIIVKCSYGRPSIPDIKSCLTFRLGLKSDFIVSILNHRHLLLRFESQEDFLLVLLRKSLYIKGYLFRFFRWSASFDFEKDPSMMPIRVGFPGLLVSLYNEDYLRSIANNLGQVLWIHEATLAWTQTVEALVCIDLNIVVPLQEKIWIGYADQGFWQKNKNSMPKRSDAPSALVPTANEWKPVHGRKPAMVAASEVDPVVQGDVQALGSQAGAAILVSSMPSSSTFNDRTDLPLSPAGDKDFVLHDVNAVQAQGSDMGDPEYVSSKGVHLSLGSKGAILRVHGAELAQAEGPCRNGDGAAASSSLAEHVTGDVDGEENP
ncbi:hypothetical protein Taro_015547 [Colocasia esculenta]|uniref:DUF4283 domain-containing protein n=1 Tax=Colocasia esculenta TaxID=4460 RepID=A0A843UQ72_COLES|nr:hypothetical protein [Colocasia esculenta]